MIFVTVGTHEQQFNRLIQEIDRLKEQGEIKEDVVIQTGYSTYVPKYCVHQKIFPYDEMQRYIAEATIVITHGGPSSFIAPLQLKKIPIVVPRQHQFDEHVNNHQTEFVKEVAKRFGNIIPVYDITKLGETIHSYHEKMQNMKEGTLSNNAEFNRRLGEIVDGLFV